MDDIVAPALTQAQYPSDEREWDQLKGVIIRMYEHDDKPLREVQEALQTLYLFKARYAPRQLGFMRHSKLITHSTKQYKSRFKQWGLSKSNNKHEAQAILHLKRARDAIGKRSEIQLRGRIVDIADVERYARRAKLPAVDPNSPQVPKILEEVHCRTPSPQPSLLLSSSITPVTVFGTIAAFVDGTPGEHHPLTDPLWIELRRDSYHKWYSMLSAFSKAQQLQEYGEIQLAFKWWDCTFERIQDVLRTWNAETFTLLLHQMRLLELGGNLSGLRLLRKHISLYGTAIYSSNDPRHGLMKLLNKPDFPIREASQAFLDRLGQQGHYWIDLAFRERLRVDALDSELREWHLYRGERSAAQRYSSSDRMLAFVRKQYNDAAFILAGGLG